MKPGLVDAILVNSKAETLGAARGEWYWSAMWEAGDEQYCPCGERIVSICEITKAVTGKRLEIGNKCILHFDCEGAADAAKVSASLKTITKKPDASPCGELIQYGLDTGILLRVEAKFLVDAYNVRGLPLEQRDKRVALNRRLVAQLAQNHLPAFDGNARHLVKQQEAAAAARAERVARKRRAAAAIVAEQKAWRSKR
jgi:hypothetical protein